MLNSIIEKLIKKLTLEKIAVISVFFLPVFAGLCLALGSGSILKGLALFCGIAAFECMIAIFTTMAYFSEKSQENKRAR